MARLIVKFCYMKPNKKNRSGFVEYKAKRDGVIKNLQSFTHKPTTEKQATLINKLIKKFPDIKSHELYPKYISCKTIGYASELITHIEGSSLQELSNLHEYVQYIAQRPRVVKEGTHGLFSFHDEAHHPHVHMIMYAKDGKQGYLNQTSMNGIRSAFVREIFKDDLLHIYQKQTRSRDDLKVASK